MTASEIESAVGVPLDEAILAAKLLDGWFEEIAGQPSEDGWYRLNVDERGIIGFGFRDLLRRLQDLDEVVSGPNGLCPR